MVSTLNKDLCALNFVVFGDVRSGTGVVQSSITNRIGVVCHADLFHTDLKVRREAHESYYGPCEDPENSPEWFVDTTNPVRYINHIIFDNPQHGERTIGFRVLYEVIERWELWELFEQRFREGDFCMIHVVRNPVACFVSLKQAQASGIWSQGHNDERKPIPGAISLDVVELVEFCRRHAAVRSKIKSVCRDTVDVLYRDLFLNYQQTMAKIFDFLELSYSEQPALSSRRRLRNRPLRERISNWTMLLAEVPHEIRTLMTAEDFF